MSGSGWYVRGMTAFAGHSGGLPWRTSLRGLGRPQPQVLEDTADNSRILDWRNKKVTLTQFTLSIHDFAENWFYSDSINDRPLLERVTHLVAVDPDAKLAALAKERGWPVIALERR